MTFTYRLTKSYHIHSHTSMSKHTHTHTTSIWLLDNYYASLITYPTSLEIYLNDMLFLQRRWTIARTHMLIVMMLVLQPKSHPHTLLRTVSVIKCMARILGYFSWSQIAIKQPMVWGITMSNCNWKTHNEHN